MKIAYASRLAWQDVTGHRGSGLELKTLLSGDNSVPDGYHLSMAKTGPSFSSPRHCHNFDQLRLSLQGALNYGPAQAIDAGEIVYFPEGVPYGPQDQSTDGENLGVVVQFGGATGHGAITPAQSLLAYAELKKKGMFVAGKFRPNSCSGERCTEVDGFQAIWQYVMESDMQYPAARYKSPIHMYPANFPWLNSPDANGVREKHLGTFSERKITVSLLKILAGRRYVLPWHTNIQLFFFERRRFV